MFPCIGDAEDCIRSNPIHDTKAAASAEGSEAAVSTPSFVDESQEALHRQESLKFASVDSNSSTEEAAPNHADSDMGSVGAASAEPCQAKDEFVESDLTDESSQISFATKASGSIVGDAPPRKMSMIMKRGHVNTAFKSRFYNNFCFPFLPSNFIYFTPCSCSHVDSVDSSCWIAAYFLTIRRR